MNFLKLSDAFAQSLINIISILLFMEHAGDVHPSILCDMSDPEQAKVVHQAVDEVFAATLGLDLALFQVNMVLELQNKII